MTRHTVLTALAVTVMAGALTTLSAQSQGNRYSATLVPGQENPALSTPASGTITLNIDEAAGEITYELSYTGLVDVRQSHIHFEKPAVNGGIFLWLCKTTINPGPTPGKTPECPVGSGTVSGTLNASDVQGIVATAVQRRRLRVSGRADPQRPGVRERAHRGEPGRRDPRSDPAGRQSQVARAARQSPQPPGGCGLSGVNRE